LSAGERLELRLALAMGRTRDELRDSLTVSEYADWQELYRVEPWGGPAEDERLRLLAAWLVSSWSTRRHGPRDFDFSWSEAAKHYVPFKTGLSMLTNHVRK
jgi:hypothetical protein